MFENRGMVLEDRPATFQALASGYLFPADVDPCSSSYQVSRAVYDWNLARQGFPDSRMKWRQACPLATAIEHFFIATMKTFCQFSN
jgi:hypothetical protein